MGLLCENGIYYEIDFDFLGTTLASGFYTEVSSGESQLISEPSIDLYNDGSDLGAIRTNGTNL